MRNRLAVGVGGTIVLVLVTATLVVSAFAWVAQDVAGKTDRTHRLLEAAARFESAATDQSAEAYEILVDQEIGDIDQYVEAGKTLAAGSADLIAAARGDPALRSIVEPVIAAAQHWQTEFGDPLVESVRRGETLDIATKELGERHEVALTSALDELHLALAMRQEAAALEIDDTSRILIVAVLGAAGVLTVAFLVVGTWLFRSIGGPLGRLNRTAEALVAGHEVTFEPEHDDEIGALALVLERLRTDAAQRYEVARDEAVQAAAFNQLAELMSFAVDEGDLVRAAVRTLERLVFSPAGDVLLINASQNRLTVSAAWGAADQAIGELVPLERIDRCPGIRRATAYLAPDIADAMNVRCPAHPAEAGTVVCVPMPALGQMVGVIHLASPERNAFDADQVRVASRIAEQVALAIANARLMSTMERLSMTDALTGLHNARFFDPYLEQELAAAERDQEPLAVIMIDLDHFKGFNDVHGHPGGDEALRAFARALRTSLRASDVVARYGGEEFVVCARRASLDEARGLAEKIRIAVEQTVVELGPGRFARMTASFGVAGTADRRLDRQALMRAADEALYQAKAEGRNRVVTAATATDGLLLEPVRRVRERPDKIGPPAQADAPTP